MSMGPMQRGDLIQTVRYALEEMTESERAEFMGEILEGYCRACYRDTLPCYCQRDE